MCLISSGSDWKEDDRSFSDVFDSGGVGNCWFNGLIGSGSVGSSKNLLGKCMVRRRLEFRVESVVLNRRLGVIAILNFLLDFGVRGRGVIESKLGLSTEVTAGSPKTGPSSEPLTYCVGPCTAVS